MMRGLARLRRRLRSINERYRTPRIAMSPMVRWSLGTLRIYLLLLVLLLVYKFAITLTGG